MSRSSKNHGGGHKGGGNNKPDKVCKTDSTPDPKPNHSAR